MRYLRSDCNEVGFSFKQLDALTRLGQSTKKSTAGRQKGYIGEKGIGFKSVFKVVNVVHVASNYYEFKLDRNEPIGMIVPICSPFPSTERIPGHTQFLLEVKDVDDYVEIQHDLKTIEPQLLMFLRRLEKLRVSTPEIDNTYSRQDLKSDDQFGGETVMITMQNTGSTQPTQRTKYIVHRHNVKSLPAESRREGITVSEVILGFPIHDSAAPMICKQSTFAFLPIGRFGFRVSLSIPYLMTHRDHSALLS
jgi:hypothetical protein